MPPSTLAFLENFYTGVTLHVPAELATFQPAAEVPVAAAVAAVPAVATPTVVIAATAPATVAAGPPAAGLSVAATPAASAAVAGTVAPPPPVAAVAPLPAPAAASAATAAAAPPAAAPPPPSPAAATPFSTLGSNPHGVVLLVRLPPEQFLKLPRTVFLNKMLQALNLVMADVVLVNVESPLVVTLAGLRRELAATQIVAFGRDLLDVALRTTQIYEPVQFPSLGLSYLSSATVESVEYDVSLKKRLWPGLQRMFLA